jgi:hypothetical protein
MDTASTIENERPKLYYAYSNAKLKMDGRLYKDVRVRWAVLERAQPVIRIESLFGKSSDVTEFNEQDGVQIWINECFTEEEYDQLEKYLINNQGIDCHKFQMEFSNIPSYYDPCDYDDGRDRYNLFVEPDYNLSFKVGGYFNRKGLIPEPGIFLIEEDEIVHGISFIQKILKGMGRKRIRNEHALIPVLQKLFELGYTIQKGLTVNERSIKEHIG